jgi:hypothetical protein
MRRGVFAIAWYLLLSTTLVDLYLIYNGLIFSELSTQGTLMDAEEAFYAARNFEFDFRSALKKGTTGEFLEYWGSRGNLTYGYLSEFPEKSCEQANATFDEFLNSTVLKRDGLLIFSPVGARRSCVALEIDLHRFKTYGIVVSTVCVNTSSPLFLC